VGAVRTLLVAGVGAGVVVASAAAPASAAQWNAISGSDSTVWVVSQILRHITTPNDKIQVALSNVVTGQQWRVINANTGTQFGSAVSITNTSAFTIASGVAGNPPFYNSFRASKSGSFSGAEYY